MLSALLCTVWAAPIETEQVASVGIELSALRELFAANNWTDPISYKDNCFYADCGGFECNAQGSLTKLNLARPTSPYKLHTLPASLGNLVNLEYLFLHSNSIKAIPDSIGKLQKLKELVLQDNKHDLGAIPESIGSLLHLELLFFSLM